MSRSFGPHRRNGRLSTTPRSSLLLRLGGRCPQGTAPPSPGTVRAGGFLSPGAFGFPAPMGSVDRWPLAILPTQIPGGSHPVVAAVRRRVHGVWSPHPRAVCRSPLPPSGRSSGVLRADRFLRNYNVGKWMVACVPPVRRGCRSGRVPRAPPPVMATYLLPFRGRGPSPPRGVGPEELVIWLILPVVICLSQRLSHACLSISTLYRETANGSLNQLSFI